jgi:hypothetical protein
MKKKPGLATGLESTTKGGDRRGLDLGSKQVVPRRQPLLKQDQIILTRFVTHAIVRESFGPRLTKLKFCATAPARGLIRTA